jgi:hypothetical protein
MTPLYGAIDTGIRYNKLKTAITKTVMAVLVME